MLLTEGFKCFLKAFKNFLLPWMRWLVITGCSPVQTYVIELRWRSLKIKWDMENRSEELENELCIPLPRTNYYKNSFSYSGPILWNKLPCNVRQAESLTKFKCLHLVIIQFWHFNKGIIIIIIIFLNKSFRERHSWKAAFYLIFFYNVDIL